MRFSLLIATNVQEFQALLLKWFASQDDAKAGNVA